MDSLFSEQGADSVSTLNQQAEQPVVEYFDDLPDSEFDEEFSDELETEELPEDTKKTVKTIKAEQNNTKTESVAPETNGAILPNEFTNALFDELGLEYDEGSNGNLDMDGLVDVVNRYAEMYHKEQFVSPEVEKLNNYLNNGGTMEDYFREVYQNTNFKEYSDADILYSYYTDLGKKEEWIKNKIDKLTINGLLTEEADEVREDFLERERAERQQFLNKQEIERANYEKGKEQASIEFYKKLLDSSDINNNKISKGLAEKMMRILIDPINDSGATQFANIINDESKVAKILQLELIGWDFNKLNTVNKATLSKNILDQLHNAAKRPSTATAIQQDADDGDSFNWMEKARKERQSKQ